MNKHILTAVMLTATIAMQGQYSSVGDRIKTQWSETINVDNVHPEYPRPIMERERWSNLNGLWDYAITDKGAATPGRYEGRILVPFAIESSLSGVGRTVGDDHELWYHRSFTVPASWKDDAVMLNFGAVDWKCDVWVNDVKVGSHTGGYTPFSMDITAAIHRKGANELRVRVWDPTDSGTQPRGKQVAKPKGIWYTSVTGIWQTVWLEPVAATHISNIKTVPDIDANTLTVTAESNAPDARGLMVEVKVKQRGVVVASGRSIYGLAVEVEMPATVDLWSPEAPNLYDLDVTLLREGKAVDKVKSYAAMRKFSTKRDGNGIVRLQLNNEDLFQFGPLDQGWWPDGLYTAPSYEAMAYDLDMTKQLGFNMIRKHVKVEPAVWYAYCDRKGIIVWQDMPSGDSGTKWQNRSYFDGVEFCRSAESEAQYRREWQEVIDLLYSYPCIGMWIPFNEAWGQFKTEEIAEWTKAYDPSRLVNPASGGNFYSCGDVLDLHNYPGPEMYLYDGQRANVLGEYGGIGYVVTDHVWTPDRSWGYIQFNSPKAVTDEYVKYAEALLALVSKGFSAAIYTQTTDVEIEVNGLMTYDRKVVKVEQERVADINRRLCRSLPYK
jgi:beta-galactosidase/beta-glucuronidase